MAEVPHMPTKPEILEKAIELFMYDNPGAPTPEEYELKEGNYWLRARDALMTGVRSELESYLAYLQSEVDTTLEALGIERIVPEERITELEDKLSALTEHYKTTKTRLAETREELRRIEEKKPPPPPPPPPMGLGPDEKRRLEDSFRRVFEEAGVTRIPMASFRDELAGLQEDLKEEERTRAFRLAYKQIVSLARSLLPVRPPPPRVAPPAPPPERPPVAVPMVELLGPRRRVIETFTCWHPDCEEACTLDRDLMRRVTVVSVLKEISPRGPRYEPLLAFPPRFYYTCETHRDEKFGFKSIYDALAFLLFESRSSGKRLAITKGTFTAAGLDQEDLRNIQAAEARWMVGS